MCGYCDFKHSLSDYEKKSTLGFDNSWSGAEFIKCIKSHYNSDAENGILRKGHFYIEIAGDDIGYFEIYHCLKCGRKLNEKNC